MAHHVKQRVFVCRCGQVIVGDYSIAKQVCIDCKKERMHKRYLRVKAAEQDGV